MSDIRAGALLATPFSRLGEEIFETCVYERAGRMAVEKRPFRGIRIEVNVVSFTSSLVCRSLCLPMRGNADKPIMVEFFFWEGYKRYKFWVGRNSAILIRIALQLLTQSNVYGQRSNRTPESMGKR